MSDRLGARKAAARSSVHDGATGAGIPDTEGDPDAAAALAKSGKRRAPLTEPIPIEWHDNSTKTFEVPRGGTDQANFDIDSPRMRKWKKK